jgi:hypothetical protein
LIKALEPSKIKLQISQKMMEDNKKTSAAALLKQSTLDKFLNQNPEDSDNSHLLLSQEEEDNQYKLDEQWTRVFSRDMPPRS